MCLLIYLFICLFVWLDKFVGLINQGATCYLSSLLQELYFTPELRRGLYALTEEELGIDQMDEFKQLNEKVKATPGTKFKDEEIDQIVDLDYSKSRV